MTRLLTLYESSSELGACWLTKEKCVIILTYTRSIAFFVLFFGLGFMEANSFPDDSAESRALLSSFLGR